MPEYAVLWNGCEGEATGRLSVLADRFELTSGERRVVVRFADLVDVTIGRKQADRLRGLPVLWLRHRDGRALRLASLQGPGILHELSRLVAREPG
ncbi:MAG TPA: hypothetical protein VIU81_03315 [Gaiellaceae bacterium]